MSEKPETASDRTSHHNAGIDQYAGSLYIDSVIPRSRDTATDRRGEAETVVPSSEE